MDQINTSEELLKNINAHLIHINSELKELNKDNSLSKYIITLTQIQQDIELYLNSLNKPYGKWGYVDRGW